MFQDRCKAWSGNQNTDNIKVLGMLNGKVGLLAGKTSVFEGFGVCINGRQYWTMITKFFGGNGALLS